MQDILDPILAGQSLADLRSVPSVQISMRSSLAIDLDDPTAAIRDYMDILAQRFSLPRSIGP
jgi:hypothetical protein